MFCPSLGGDRPPTPRGSAAELRTNIPDNNETILFIMSAFSQIRFEADIRPSPWKSMVQSSYIVTVDDTR